MTRLESLLAPAGRQGGGHGTSTHASIPKVCVVIFSGIGYKLYCVFMVGIELPMDGGKMHGGPSCPRPATAAMHFVKVRNARIPEDALGGLLLAESTGCVADAAVAAARAPPAPTFFFDLRVFFPTFASSPVCGSTSGCVMADASRLELAAVASVVFALAALAASITFGEWE